MASLPEHLVGKGATKGNRRAVKHGARSELAIVPAREERARALREMFPELDGLRLALLADRLARIAVASAWLDQQQNGVVRDRHGNVYDVADKVEAWSRAAEKMLAEIQAESRGAQTVDLARVMAELDAAEEAENG